MLKPFSTPHNSQKYATQTEQQARFLLFKENLVQVDLLNAASKAENSTAVFGINALSDLSPKEFESNYLGVTMPSESDRRLIGEAEVEAFTGESTSVDWSGVLTTPVKNQGQCGSCW